MHTLSEIGRKIIKNYSVAFFLMHRTVLTVLCCGWNAKSYMHTVSNAYWVYRSGRAKFCRLWERKLWVVTLVRRGFILVIQICEKHAQALNMPQQPFLSQLPCSLQLRPSFSLFKKMLHIFSTALHLQGEPKCSKKKKHLWHKALEAWQRVKGQDWAAPRDPEELHFIIHCPVK